MRWEWEDLLRRGGICYWWEGRFGEVGFGMKGGICYWWEGGFGEVGVWLERRDLVWGWGREELVRWGLA